MPKARARMLGVSKNKEIIAISSLDEVATDAPDRLYGNEGSERSDGCARRAMTI